MKDETERADALRVLADIVAAEADRIEDQAVDLLPFPRKVIRDDITLAQRRLRGFSACLPALSGREPVGQVALCLPGNAILSNPMGTIGSSFLSGNHTIARLPGARRDWAAILAALVGRALPGAVRFDHAGGREFIVGAMADRDVQVLMIFGDDAWAGGYESLARGTGTKVLFEGPGKDPFLVFADASVPTAARAAVTSSCFNAGQACTAPERFYVTRECHDEFVGEVVDAVARLHSGDTTDPATDIGPLAPGVAARLLAQVDQAVRRGAKLLLGGHAKEVRAAGERRVLVAPTVLTDVDETMDVMRLETFGPVVPVARVDSAQQAIRLAQDSPYGLSATVFGGAHTDHAALAATHGRVHVNETWLEHRRREPLAPYGGRRASGWVWEWQGDSFVRRDGPRSNVREFSRSTGTNGRASG